MLVARWARVNGDYITAITTNTIAIPNLHYVAAFNPFPGSFSNGETGIRFGRSATTIRDLPESPTRNGHTFAGWQLPDGEVLEGNLQNFQIRGDTLLLALWEESELPAGATTNTESRSNPQTSPIAVSLMLFSAVLCTGITILVLAKLNKRRIAAAVEYRASKARFVREVRMVIKGKRCNL